MAIMLGLGSNLKDRLGNLTRGIQELIVAGVHAEVVSSVYETEATDFKEQPDFLNLALKVETILEPRRLLQRCMEIEQRMGRERAIPFGPRIIDLDILLWHDDIIQEKDLIIPHPRLHQRRFVLTPLNEIVPFMIHPVLNQTVEEILLNLQDSSRVEWYCNAQSISPIIDAV